MHTDSKQQTLWILAALAAPVLHFSGCGWFAAGILTAVFLPLVCLPRKWEEMPKPLAWAEAVSFGVAAGMLLPCSAVYWPSDNDLAVPLTLLILAALTKSESAPRIGAVLALCMGLLAAPLLVAGGARVEPGWLVPWLGEWPAGLCAAFLLLCLPSGRGRGTLGAVAGIAAAGAILIQGTISSPVAAGIRDAFYQTARTLGHWETVAAAGMTFGWYAMATMLIRSGQMVMAGAGICESKGSGAVTAAAFAGILLKGGPYYVILVIVGGLLWVIVPFWNAKRKSKKVEKRC